jgi:hypothetical protein
MITHNLHSLFTSNHNDCFEEQISLTSTARAHLTDARKDLRDHLRADLPKRLAAQRLEEHAERVMPKFITQGSYAYRLLNAPARPPRQQADLDDGLYLPLSFCEDTGSPKAASKALIDLLETSIRMIASERHWHINTDNPNCTRIVIAPDQHIDVPLYSIPDHEFRAIVQKRHALAKSMLTLDSFAIADSLDDRWELMPPRVRLAHKLKGWLDSDPRPLKDWIERQVLLKTEQLRRVIRYLKAWRDAQSWPDGDPKSLLFMALADAALDRHISSRDDLALLQVCERIPVLLCRAVSIPVIPEQDLTRALDEDEIRALFLQRIGNLQQTLSACISGRHAPSEACAMLRAQFGPRFPDRPDRIVAETPEATVHATAPRHISAAPMVGRRTSG